MIGVEVEVGGRYGADSPLGLGGESLGLVIGGSRGDDLVTVLVHGSRREQSVHT